MITPCWAWNLTNTCAGSHTISTPPCPPPSLGVPTHTNSVSPSWTAQVSPRVDRCRLNNRISSVDMCVSTRIATLIRASSITCTILSALSQRRVSMSLISLSCLGSATIPPLRKKTCIPATLCANSPDAEPLGVSSLGSSLSSPLFPSRLKPAHKKRTNTRAFAVLRDIDGAVSAPYHRNCCARASHQPRLTPLPP